MTRKQIFLLAGAIIAVIIIFITIKVFQPASKSVRKEKPDFQFTVPDLVNEFESDEEAANSLYLDKIIQVNGTIENIADDETSIILTLRDPEAISGVLCSFDKSITSVNKFTLGSDITVKGICTGYLLDVVLIKCIVVE